MNACWARIRGSLVLLLFLVFLTPREVFHECAQQHAAEHATGASVEEDCSICATPLQHFTETHVLHAEGLARHSRSQAMRPHVAVVVDMAKADDDRGPPARG